MKNDLRVFGVFLAILNNLLQGFIPEEPDRIFVGIDIDHVGVDKRWGDLNVAAGIDGIGDAEFVFQQTEQVNLFVIPVDVVFFVELVGGGCRRTYFVSSSLMAKFGGSYPSG